MESKDSLTPASAESLAQPQSVQPECDPTLGPLCVNRAATSKLFFSLSAVCGILFRVYGLPSSVGSDACQGPQGLCKLVLPVACACLCRGFSGIQVTPFCASGQYPRARKRNLPPLMNKF